MIDVVRLIVDAERCTVAAAAVHEFQSAILADDRVRPALLTTGPGARAFQRGRRVLSRAPVLRSLHAATHTDGLTSGRPEWAYFVVMMGPQAHRCFPYFLRHVSKNVYLFDAWPKRHGAVCDLVRRWAVESLFVSSSQVAAALQPMLAECRVTWIPEGVDPSAYRSLPASQRDIDVLQMGRMHAAYHARIAAALQRKGRTYLYEVLPGRLVFPAPGEFVSGLSSAKISVCFPQSMTHPERAGAVETMTQRYLQSMVSQCLVVGHAPQEMVDLFGYNPVVEADMDHPGEQLLAILDDMDAFTPLIQRNYRMVVAHHTWAHRWRDIAGVLLSRSQSHMPLS